MAKSTKSPTSRTSRKKAAPKQKSSSTGKLASVLERLQQAGGATLADLEKLTGWQPHSIRAALTGFRNKGTNIARSKNADGVSVYSAPKA